VDHERLAQPLWVVVLHDLYGRDVGPHVAVGVPPPLQVDDAQKLLLPSRDPAESNPNAILNSAKIQTYQQTCS
jgi:hypothetical protein